MKIIVLIKQVPETDGLEIDIETGTVKRDGVESIINPLDLYALESAFKIRDKNNCEITALTMGPPGAKKALKEALSMGADKAVLLTDRKFAGSDTYSTSYILSSAIRKLGGYDLIICGEKATDGDTAQVGPGTAAFLNLPAVTFVSSLSLIGKKLYLERMVESGIEKYRTKLPLLVSVIKAIGEPRLPTLKGKRKAKTINIIEYGAKDLNLDYSDIGTKGSPTMVHCIHKSKVMRKPEIIRAVNDEEIDMAVDRLIEFLDSKRLISKGKEK